MKKISLILSLLLFLNCFSFVNIADVKAEAPAITVKNGTIIEWEAEGEHANIMHHYAVGSDTAGASGEGFVYVPRNIGLRSQSVWPSDTPPHIYYNLDVQEEGVYYLWIRAYSVDSGSDSVFVCFDSAPPSYNELIEYGEWSWFLVSTEHLSLGHHTFNFFYRELNTRIDKVILTTIPDYNPSGNKYSTPEFLPEFGDDATLEYPLPALTPPENVHPRVLLRKENIPEIRKNLNHPQNRDVYDMLQREAAQNCNGVFPPMASSAYTNVVGLDLACGESNAFLYLMTGEKQYADKAITIALNAMRTMTNRKGTDHATRLGGNCIFAVSKIYDWCYDVMTDEQRDEIRAYMYLHISMTEVAWPANEQGDFNSHAQEGILWVDLLAAGIATYDEDPKLYNTVAGRVLTTMAPIKNKWYNSIFQGEGANYGPMRYQFEIMCAHLFRGMGYENVFNPYQQYQRYSQFWQRRPDGRMLKTADDANEEMYGYFAGYHPGLFSTANYYKDPYLKRQYYKENQKGLVSGSSQGSITCAMFLILNDVNVPANATYRDFSLTVFGGYPQNRMTARTSWDEGVDSDTLLVSMNVLGNMLPGHQHVDVGHFDIFYKGSLAIDSGIYESASYVGEDGKLVTSSLQLAAGSPHEKTYHKATVAHNCMLVYDPSETYADSKILRVDGGQRRWFLSLQNMSIENAMSDEHETGEVISYDYGPDITTPAYSYLKGNITKAYTKKVKHYTRSFMFLNFFDKEYPGALIVMDNVESSDPSFKKSWLLHSQEEPEVVGAETTIRRTELGQNGKLLNTTLLPKDHVITKIGGPGHEFDVNGVNFYAKPKTKVQEAGNWRIEVSPKKAANHDYFLNVMQITENNNAPEPLAVELIENDDRYAGVEIKDRVVYLRKDDLISTRDLKVQSMSKSGKFMFIIDGLKEGNWNVYDKAGKLVSTQVAYPGNNTISFEGEAGEYTIKWKYAKIGEKDFINEDRVVDENPLDVKVNLVYETFKTGYFDGDEAYFAIEEILGKLEEEYEFENNVITFTNRIVIDLNKGTYKTSKTSDEKIKNFSKKDGMHYTTFEEFTKVMGYNYYQNPVSKIIFITTPESSIDKYMFENSKDPDRIAVKKVTACAETTASQYQSIDDNVATFWSAAGEGCWVIYEFEKPEVMTAIDIYWGSGDTRAENYEIWISEDGENYENIFDGKSSGRYLGFERHNVTSNKKYKFVKVVGNMNSTNEWNSMAEIRFFKPVN